MGELKTRRPLPTLQRYTAKKAKGITLLLRMIETLNEHGKELFCRNYFVV
jgi:hypothetical protein